jgi:nitroimidazol reductase NimA-like FMN-containing flavoprotein (pyridoxamine 5'-phosphate oxidase superfamily)
MGPLDGLSDAGRALLAGAPYGFLGTASAEGPYTVPMSYAVDGDAVVFHTGPGRKSEALLHASRVCLVVTDSPRLVTGEGACRCTFDFRSILVEGDARLLERPGERERALRSLVAKYHPAAAALDFTPELLERTLVYTITIATASEKHHPRP